MRSLANKKDRTLDDSQVHFVDVKTTESIEDIPSQQCLSDQQQPVSDG